MKSQMIRTRSLPGDPSFYEKTVHVKPTGTLVCLLVIGFVVIFLKPYLLITGISMMLLAIFCLAVMPDRKLCSFTKDYLVLYNCHDRGECMLVYWNEIVNWHYEWHKSWDSLVINLEDGSVETQDMYSLHSIKRQMENHAPGKMKKNIRIRKENV